MSAMLILKSKMPVPMSTRSLVMLPGLLSIASMAANTSVGIVTSPSGQSHWGVSGSNGPLISPNE